MTATGRRLGGTGLLLVLATGVACRAPFSAVARPERPPDEEVVLLSLERVELQDVGGEVPQALVTSEWQQLYPGKGTAQDVVVDYDRELEEVVSFDVDVVLPDGTVLATDLGQRRDVASFSRDTFFSSHRLLVQPHPRVPPGGIIRHRLVTRRKDAARFAFAQAFAATDRLAHVVLEVTAPEGWELSHRTLSGHDEEQFPPVVSRAQGRTVWRWERRDVAARPAFAGAPEQTLVVPITYARLASWTSGGVQHRGFADERALSAWLHEQYLRRGPLPPAVTQAALSRCPGTPEERARCLYEVVAREVQYCAIEVGYGGWVPHGPGEVQRRGYGDCKDKANYLRALLDAAGIASRPALVYAHRGFPRPFTIPALGTSFNHVVLLVDLPGRTLLADPTWRSVPFGMVPYTDADAPLLPLKQGGQSLERSPACLPAEHGSRTTARLTLDARGDAAGSFSLELRGQGAVSVRERLLQGGRTPLEVIDAELPLLTQGLEEASHETQDFSPALTARGRLRRERFLKLWPGQPALLRFADVWASGFFPWTVDWRAVPLLLGHVRRDEAELRLQLPPGFTVARLPAPVALDAAEGRFELRWSLEGHALVVHHLAERKVSHVQGAALRRYLDFQSQVAQAFSEPVLLLPRPADGRAEARP